MPNIIQTRGKRGRGGIGVHRQAALIRRVG